ncbi:peptide ABC transporter substrate-binding protein [Brevibacillus fluminis]|uniref:peptide ABC transporter substrate-binding protein n=1 Tax=Brevibacillus fluminis TaxID=511487 RepID=UPI003F8AAF03
MRKNAFVLLSSIALASAAMAGCAGNQTQESAQPSTTNQEATAPSAAKTDSAKPKLFRIAITSEPSTADPAIAEDNQSNMMVTSTFAGLTRIGEDDKPHEEVAEKIDVSPDGLTYTFHLRDSKWSNGDPVTAHDFEFAWKRALAPETASNYAYQLYYIKGGEAYNTKKGKVEDVGVKALDDKTLEVKLANPTPFFLELTAFMTYMPVNEKVVKANPKWALEAATHVGNGPYKLADWQHKSKIELTKNDTYWDKDNVKMDKIDVSMIEDENTALSMFDNGELDWDGAPYNTIPLDAMPSLKDSGKVKIKPIATSYWYKFNTEKAPFNNAKIRKAFAYAIDRKSLIDNVTQADQLPAMGLFPPSMAVKPDGYFKDNDVETAKQLLAEGMKELGITKRPPITISHNAGDGHKKIAEAIQGQWKKALGVDTKIESQEFKVYLETLHQGTYQVGRIGWIPDFNDAINYAEVFKDKNGGNNDTRWENPRYKELVNQAGKETDPQKRKALFAEAEQIIMDEMPFIPIYYYTRAWVEGDNVAHGIYQDPLGNSDLKWVDMK